MSNFTDVFGSYTVPPTESSYSLATILAGETAELVWPHQYDAAESTHLATAIIEVSSGAGSSLNMPRANSASVGQDILIRNVGAHTLSILDHDGVSITTLAAGTAKYFYLSSNDTEAGIWGVFTYGTGTSGADAVALAGTGLRASGNKLQANVPYRAFNSDLTVVASDRACLLDAQTAGLTITLPTTATVGQGFFFFVRNSSPGSLTIQPSGGQTLDGLMVFTLAPGESARVVSTSTSWVSVGYGRDLTFVFNEVVVDASVGDVVLTSDQVAGRMIRITGTATANIEVTLPTVDNIYFVTTEAGLGAFSATFTTGSGSTVSLPANQGTILYCDGTNVRTALTTTVTSDLSLSDGSAAAPTIFYSLDTDTGFYRSADGTVSFTSNGVESARFGPNGFEAGIQASAVTVVPSGGIVSTDAQAALEELSGELASLTPGDIGAQPLLVSGVNIKTVNGESILGPGDVETLDLAKTQAIALSF